MDEAPVAEELTLRPLCTAYNAFTYKLQVCFIGQGGDGEFFHDGVYSKFSSLEA